MHSNQKFGAVISCCSIHFLLTKLREKKHNEENSLPFLRCVSGSIRYIFLLRLSVMLRVSSLMKISIWLSNARKRTGKMAAHNLRIICGYLKHPLVSGIMVMKPYISENMNLMVKFLLLKYVLDSRWMEICVNHFLVEVSASGKHDMNDIGQ